MPVGYKNSNVSYGIWLNTKLDSKQSDTAKLKPAKLQKLEEDLKECMEKCDSDPNTS